MATLDPLKTYLTRSQQVTWKSLDGESVLLNLDSGVYFTLNETGTAAWELLDGKTPLAAVSQTLCQRFDITLEQAQQDLIELAQALLDEGLVKVTDGSSATS